MISVYIHLFCKNPESGNPLSKGHHQASGTMKIKELSKLVRAEVVKKYRSGVGYKKISKTFNIPWSTNKSIIKKCKEYGTTINLPREGRPPKLTDQARRALIRETKRPKTTLTELQTSQRRLENLSIGPVSCTLHRAGLYGRVARKKAFA
jgi:transposase